MRTGKIKFLLERVNPPPTPGPWQIGDFARAKDTLSVIIVEIDTRIYKTYPELDLTIVPQLSERYYEFNL